MWSFKHTGLSLMLALGLAGCGFQPRGVVGIAAAYQPIGLAADPYAPLTAELRQQLQGNDIAVAVELTQAQSVIRLLEGRCDRRALSTSGSGKILEFELSCLLRYDVVNPQGENLVPAQNLRLRRDYLNQADSVLGVADEEAILRQEMQRELLQQLVRQLTARLR